MVEPTEPTESPGSPEAKRRSRTTLIAVTAGVLVAGALVAYGFSRSDDDRDTNTKTPPTIGVIQAPAQVVTTLGPAVSPGTAPATVDLPLVPAGTADVAFPPVSSDIVVP
ncbi:MAG: hypothetical protein ABI706_14860 [Ilumatobacteraceae bacterium]